MYRIIIICIILSIAYPAFAEDFVIGKLMSIDKKNNTLIVEIIQFRNNDQHKLHKGDRLLVDIDTDTLCKFMVPEVVVRIWGNFNKDRFDANYIRGMGMGYGRQDDATGVRNRLGRGRHHMKNHKKYHNSQMCDHY